MTINSDPAKMPEIAAGGDDDGFEPPEAFINPIPNDFGLIDVLCARALPQVWWDEDLGPTIELARLLAAAAERREGS